MTKHGLWQKQRNEGPAKNRFGLAQSWLYGSLAIALAGTLLQTVVLRLDYTHNFLNLLLLGAAHLYYPLFTLVVVFGSYFLVAKRSWQETALVSLLTIPAFACATNILVPGTVGNDDPLLGEDTPRKIFALTIRYAATLFLILVLSRLLVRTAHSHLRDERVVVGLVLVSAVLFGLTIPHKNYQATQAAGLVQKQQLQSSLNLPFKIYIPSAPTVSRNLLANSGSVNDARYLYQFSLPGNGASDFTATYNKVVVEEFAQNSTVHLGLGTCTGFYSGSSGNEEVGPLPCEASSTANGAYGHTSVYHIPQANLTGKYTEEQYVAVIGSTFVSLQLDPAPDHPLAASTVLAMFSSMVPATSPDLRFMQQ